MARITIADDAGRKRLKWVPLEAATAAEARAEFRNLLVEHGEDRLRHMAGVRIFLIMWRRPTTHGWQLGKRPDTFVTERVHLKQLGET